MLNAQGNGNTSSVSNNRVNVPHVELALELKETLIMGTKTPTMGFTPLAYKYAFSKISAPGATGEVPTTIVFPDPADKDRFPDGEVVTIIAELGNVNVVALTSRFAEAGNSVKSP